MNETVVSGLDVEDDKDNKNIKKKENIVPLVSTQLITFNVGGELFTFCAETLEKHGSNYLVKCFEWCNDISETVIRDKDGNLFLDRDPYTFRLLAKCIRGAQHHLIDSTDAELRCLCEEADFFGFTDLSALLESYLYPVLDQNQKELVTQVRDLFLMFVTSNEQNILKDHSWITLLLKDWFDKYIESPHFASLFRSKKNLFCQPTQKGHVQDNKNKEVLKLLIPLLKLIATDFTIWFRSRKVVFTTTNASTTNGLVLENKEHVVIENDTENKDPLFSMLENKIDRINDSIHQHQQIYSARWLLPLRWIKRCIKHIKLTFYNASFIWDHID